MHGSGRGRAVGERAGDDAWARARVGSGRASGRAGGQRGGERASNGLPPFTRAVGPRAPRAPIPSPTLPCAAHLLLPARLRPSRALLVSASPDRAALAHPVLQQPLMIHPTPPPLARSLAGWFVPAFMHAPPCQSPAAPGRPATAAPHVWQPCASNAGW
jgi:hypothetical protein